LFRAILLFEIGTGLPADWVFLTSRLVNGSIDDALAIPRLCR